MASGTSLVPPLEALRSVRHIMISGFPDVDVGELHRFVNDGVTKQLATTAAADFRYDPASKRVVIERPRMPDASIRDSEEAAARSFDRVVRPKMKRFAQMMEAVAPAIIGFGRALDVVRSYISEELKQTRTMMAFAIILFVAAFLMLLFMMMKIMHNWREILKMAKSGDVVDKGISSEAAFSAAGEAGRTVLAFLSANTLIWMWIRTSKERIKGLHSIRKDLVFFERYEKMLVNNVFVRYAFAYTKGEHEQFVRSQMVQQMQEAEEEADEMESVCAEAGVTASRRRFERGKCKLEGCDYVHKSLDETLANFVEHAWASRSDVDACGALMLNLLEYLTAIHDGSIFDERDKHSMWIRIQKRINMLQRFAYRELDVDASDPAKMRSDVSLIRDCVLPLMRLTVVESRELEPDGAVGRYADPSFTGKSQAWKACMDDPNCVWAAFHPYKGGLFACHGLADGQAEGDRYIMRGSIFDTVTSRIQDGGERSSVTDNDKDRSRGGGGDRRGRVRHETTPLVFARRAVSASVPDASESDEAYGGGSGWTVLVKRANLSDVMGNSARQRGGGVGGGGEAETDREDGQIVGADKSASVDKVADVDVEGATATTTPYGVDDANTTVPHTFVCAKGINAEAEIALRALADDTRAQSDTQTQTQTDGSRRRLQDLCNSVQCGQECRIVSQDAEGDPQRWAFAPDALLDVSSYRGIFAEPVRGESGSVFCMRVEPYKLFRLNLTDRSNALTTLYAILPDVVDRMYDILRRHPDRIRIERYREYLVHEMEKFYGLELYKRIEPMMQVAMTRLQNKLTTLWDAVEDTGKYITQKRFDRKLEDLEMSRVRKLVYEVGRMNLLLQNHWRNFGTAHDGMSSDAKVGITSGASGQSLKQFLTDAFVVLIVLLAMGIIDRVRCYKQGKCDASQMARAILVMLTIMIFVMSLAASNAKRTSARGRFDFIIRERNAKTLVTTTSRLLDSLSQRLEFLAGQRINEATESFRVIRSDISDVYAQIDYQAGLRRLYPDVEDEGDEVRDQVYAKVLMDTKPPDLMVMYQRVRTVIDRFDSCNSLDGNGRSPPFPTYEIVNYGIVIVGACALLWFAMKKLRPLTHIYFVSELVGIREDIKSGGPAPPDLEALLACKKSDASAIWPILTTVLTGLLLMATVMLAVYMVRYSNLYEMGLYASGLFTRSRCT